MTSLSGAAEELPVTTVDSQLPVVTCSSRSRDRAPAPAEPATTTRKKAVGRKQKQVCSLYSKRNHRTVLFYQERYLGVI